MLLSDILIIVGNVILFGGLIVAIWQLSLLSKQVCLMMQQMHQQYDWSRKQATFDYLSKYRSELHDTNLGLQKRLDLLKQDGKDADPSKIARSLYADETRLHLFELVFYFEHLAIGIAQDFFDENIAREFLSNAVTSTYKAITPYLDIRRKETGKMIGHNFETLANKWNKKQ